MSSLVQYKTKARIWTNLLIILSTCTHLISQVSLTDIAISAGIDTTYGAGEYGGGVSFVDFNRDGLDDITFATSVGSKILFYKNKGDNTFELLDLIPNTSAIKAVLWVDIDNDYDLDLYVNVFMGQNRIYLNTLTQTGVLSLVDNTGNSGLIIQNDPSYGASFGDYDQDGDLDLFVSNRSETGSQFTNVFYQNNGNGVFSNITSSVGIFNEFKPDFCSVFIDFDNDGDLDLYTIVDKYDFANRLYINNGNNHFDWDSNNSHGANIAIGAMNAGVGDANNDGWFDMYISNEPPPPGFTGGNYFLFNDGAMGYPYFYNLAAQAGVEVNQTSWGASFVDIDNDKDQDIYVSVQNSGISGWRSHLFKNITVDPSFPDFIEYYNGGLPGDTLNSFSNALGDIDNDGRMDIVVNNSYGGKMKLWKNNISNSNNYIKISLKGTESNSFGIGSRIEVYDGDSCQYRFTHCGINFLGQNSLYEHIGMAKNTMVDSLFVKWPSGIIDKFYNLSVNQKYDFTEGECLLRTEGNSIVYNLYIGPDNGSMTNPLHWSSGKVPGIHDDVLLKSTGAMVTLTNSGTMTFRSLRLEGNFLLTNSGSLNLIKSYGIGMEILTESKLINNGSLQIEGACGDAIHVLGILEDHANIVVIK